MRTVLAVALLSGSSVFAQVKSSIVGAGYASPAPVALAPGQVVTVFVQGLGGGLTEELRAARAPLPTTLGGISVLLEQTAGDPSPLAAPLFAVRPLESSCAGSFGTECGSLTAITIQVPFDLVPHNPLALAPVSNRAVLAVAQDGDFGVSIGVRPQSDNIHIVTSCDQQSSFSSLSCIPIVAHADGTLVSAGSPAAPGEVLVMYAFGLGFTDPPVQTGEISPSPPAIVADDLSLGFEFSPNAAPKRPLPAQPSPAAGPADNPLPPPGVIFAGLAPGFVGLYQVHFRVPVSPDPVPPCDFPGDFPVRSNLTVSIATFTSFDGAGICVDPNAKAALENGSTQAASVNAIPGGRLDPPANGEPFVPNFIPFPTGSDLTQPAK